MISPADLESPEYRAVPDEAKPLALWLWLNLDPMGRGLMDPEGIAARMGRPDSDTVLTHLLMLLEAGFATTYLAEGREWILLLRPLKADLRRTRIETPPPPGRPWTSVAVGREGARERARERVRAEGAARAEAWAAVEAERDVSAPPGRPLLLDAPPIGCSEHPNGTPLPCGPCRDARLRRDEWIAEKVYEAKLAAHYERNPDDTF